MKKLIKNKNPFQKSREEKLLTYVALPTVAILLASLLVLIWSNKTL